MRDEDNRDPIRAYADTSVFGGVFDDEFAAPSRLFFQQVEQGRFLLAVSDTIRREIGGAPEQVRAFFQRMVGYADVVPVTAPALRLRQEYIAAGIVSPKRRDDALHVALATVSGCDAIVSWNFKHIVHFEKIPLYNEVNRIQGYGSIAIHAPFEVIENAEDESI